jgi:hypothetical protein
VTYPPRQAQARLLMEVVEADLGVLTSALTLGRCRDFPGLTPHPERVL